jgi:hypothetical protein
VEPTEIHIGNFVALVLAKPMSLGDIQAYNETHGLKRIEDQNDFDSMREQFQKLHEEHKVYSLIHIHGFQGNPFGSALVYRVFDTQNGESTEYRDHEWDADSTGFAAGATLIFMQDQQKE